MTLIALVIALSLELLSTRAQALRKFAWFDNYAVWVRGLFGGSALADGPLGIVAVLLVPVVVLAVVQTLFAGVWLGLFSLLLAIAVLFYCLRYDPVDALVEQYVDARESGDANRAREVAGQLVEAPSAGDEGEVRQVTDAVLIQANERVFAVVFWFALLGPVGALLYRLSWRVAAMAAAEEGGDFADAAQRLRGILDWIPARLTALGYAVAGSFEDAVHEWRGVYRTLPENFVEMTHAVLRHSGAGALQLDRYRVDEGTGGEEAPVALESSAAKAARGLVMRTVVVWAIVIALLTLAGWVR